MSKSGNHFSLDDSFPEASAVFLSVPKTIDQVKESCFVVLDTNVLLAPYSLDSASIEEIRPIYRNLATKNRLKIPGRVAREYTRLRPQKLADISKVLRDIGSQLKNPFEKKVAFLDDNEDYKELLKIGKTLQEHAKKAQTHITKIVEKLQDGTGGDPILAMYRGIFQTCVIELSQSPEHRSQLSDELSKRIEAKIPPGYRDADKPDDGIGDFLIWKTILKIGSEANLKIGSEANGSDLLFVSGDEKNDWWIRNQSAFQPRPELLDEYRRASNGGTFHILPFPAFLKLFSASVDLIKATVEAERARTAKSEEADAQRLKAVYDVIFSSEPLTKNIPRSFPYLETLKRLRRDSDVRKDIIESIEELLHADPSDDEPQKAE